jgi:hypothetical protein
LRDTTPLLSQGKYDVSRALTLPAAPPPAPALRRLPAVA